MEADKAMERAYKCHGHDPDILCNVCMRFGMELINAHLEGFCAGIDKMAESANRAILEAK